MTIWMWGNMTIDPPVPPWVGNWLSENHPAFQLSTDGETISLDYFCGDYGDEINDIAGFLGERGYSVVPELSSFPYSGDYDGGCLWEDGEFSSFDTEEFVLRTLPAGDLIDELERRGVSLRRGYHREGEDRMKVRINTHGGPVPEQHGEWVDLYTAQDTIMNPGEAKLISLGIAMEIPEGYYAHVVPRSSTFLKWGIMMGNSMGVIENDYNGDNDIWGFPAYAYRNTFIPAGTRICQFRLVKKAEPVEFEPVESLGNKDRGGFGSTGD